MDNYKEIIDKICSRIHTELIDFGVPRSVAAMPTQVTSEFITNRQQGDWAEDVIFRAINENSKKIVAVRYGKSDDLVAGESGFEQFFNAYQSELDTIGKRPDLLLFNKEDFDESLGFDISMQSGNAIDEYVSKAIAGIEVRSSAFLINKYTEEAERVVREKTECAIKLRDTILAEYSDLLKQKCPELIPIMEQVSETSVRSINFRRPSWKTSPRLVELTALLKDFKESLEVLQNRHSLSITPKVEDIKVVYKWICKYNVPHFYVQVFFDKIYGISFKDIVELVSQPELEGDKYTVEGDIKNQNKLTIKIPSQDGVCLARAVTEPGHHSVRKELNRGRLLFYVKFDGGEAVLDKKNFDSLFGCDL